MSLTFPARSILRVDGNFLSEHSRSPLDVSFEQIESAKRTVNGHMRVYEVAKKHTLDVSWKLLPSRSDLTVDGYMGGQEIYQLYMSGGSVKIEIWADKYASKEEPFPMLEFDGRFKEFDFSIVKRNVGNIFYDFWDISMTLEEL